MSRYWNDYTQYSQMSVDELKKKANASAITAKNKGRDYEPIVVKGRQICNSWWGQAWCRNLEQYADYASRIDRGKRYVRSGAVVDLKVQNGKIDARVQGNRKVPYKIEIRISPLSEERCQQIIEKCGRKIQNVETLINGGFPDDLKDLFTGMGGLFPTPNEISFQCSCPDWALMCKHVAAVMYGIGAKVDENPFWFFKLRGIDVERFISVALANKVESMLANANQPSRRILDDNDEVYTLFGVLD